MFFKKADKFFPAEIILRTLFFTSSFSFVIFLLLDLAFAGFVSRVFSVHWFLLVAIVSGIWWGSLVKEKSEQKFLSSLIAGFFSLVGLYLVWQFKTELADNFIIVFLLAFFIPFLVWWLLRDN